MNTQQNLFSSTSMTPTERQMGRFMRAPDEHPAGAGGGTGTDTSQNSQQNNQGGNSGDSNGAGNQEQNNAGQPDPLAGFWSDPKPKDSAGNESGTGANGGDGNQPAGEQGQQIGQQLVKHLEGIQFADVFTKDIADAVAKDDLSSANTAFAGLARESVRQSVILSSKLMQVLGSNLMGQVETLINKRLGSRDDETSLLDAFPSARDPQARPIIQGVFEQALKHSGGDRTKAIAMTRDMLKLVGQKAAGDMGINQAPNGREDSFLGDAPSALVEELLGRK